jgi:hypothetical protein
MREDLDFKQMSPAQAQELIIFFLTTAFELPREALLQNRQSEEVRDSTLILLNANLLFY